MTWRSLLVLFGLLFLTGTAEAQRSSPATYAAAAATRTTVPAQWWVPRNEYPSYDQYVNIMHGLAATHPERCTLENWGTLPSGRQILTLRITEDVNRRSGKPQVLATASMHGDETAGYWVLLQLAESLLVEDHGGLLRDVEVYINPLANPDGAYTDDNATLRGGKRGNAHGVDLNRNYPDPDDGPHPDGYAYQAETRIFMAAAEAHSFDLALNIHGGAEVFNYPWDTYQNRHPDNDWWRRVSRDFAQRAQLASGRVPYFEDRQRGVTNGHDWYPIAGSRQDYMNYYHHCREATLEISNAKRFPAHRLGSLWSYVKPALIGYLGEARYGLAGTVVDHYTGRPVAARVFIPGHDFQGSEVYSTTEFGDYYRYLAAGTYTVEYRAEGYLPLTRRVTIRDGARTREQVRMVRDGAMELDARR